MMKIYGTTGKSQCGIRVSVIVTVEPRLSGLVGTRRNSPDNRGSG